MLMPKKGSKKKTSRLLAAGPVHPQDLFALRSLYESTGGPLSWKVKENWLTDAPLEEWTGVGVDGSTGRVTELWLRSNGLKHFIPDAIGLLSELRVLDLGGNEELVGPVPAALGNLPGLHTLSLDACKLDLDPVGASLRCTSRAEVLALFRSVGGPF